MDKKTLVKYISAFTFGDGCLYIPQGKVNARLTVVHIERNKDYLDWKADILSNFTNVWRRRVTTNVNPAVRFDTASHPLYTQIKERMYICGRKVIDPHYLKLLDWEVMAILYQDDGCVAQRPGKENTVYISTNCFSLPEQDYFRKVIADKLGVMFNINKHMGSYRLRLRTKDFHKFLDGVRPYMLPSFEYKCPDV